MDKKQNKKEKILYAATIIFRKDGFHKAKIKEIADMANVGKGTIYEYFNNKTDLFEQTLKSCIKDYSHTLKHTLSKQKNPIKKLECYINIQIENFTKYGDMARLFYQDAKNVGIEIKTLIRPIKEKIVHLLAQIFEEGMKKNLFRSLEPCTVALMFIGSVHEMVFHHLYFLQNDPKLLKPNILLDYFISGIKNR